MIVTVDVDTPSAETGPVPVIVEFAATGVPPVKMTVPSDLNTGEVIESVFVCAFSEDSVQVEIPEELLTEQVPYVLVEPRSDAENVGVSVATGLLKASRSVIVIVDVAVPSATTGPVPEIVELAANAAPALKTTVPSVLATGETMASVFVSALVEVSVQVEIPEALVAEQAPIAFVDPVSVAEKVGVSPLTGLFEASRSVITIVDVDEPSAVTGPVPEIVELAATAAPAVKTTVPSDFATGVEMESVLVSAKPDARVHVEIPVASEEEQIP